MCISVTVSQLETVPCAGCPDCPEENRKHHPTCPGNPQNTTSIFIKPPNNQHFPNCPQSNLPPSTTQPPTGQSPTAKPPPTESECPLPCAPSAKAPLPPPTEPPKENNRGPCHVPEKKEQGKGEPEKKKECPKPTTQQEKNKEEEKNTAAGVVGSGSDNNQTPCSNYKRIPILKTKSL